MQTALVKFLPLREATPGVRDSRLAAIGTLLLLVIWAMSVAAPEVSGRLLGAAAHAGFVPFLALLLLSEVLFEFLTGILLDGDRIHRIAGYVLLKGIWRITSLLDQFAYRYTRLQDDMGTRLIPAILRALGEEIAAMPVLDRPLSGTGVNIERRFSAPRAYAACIAHRPIIFIV